MSDRSSLTLALIGAGQLGGSFALALKNTGEPLRIQAYDTVPHHTEQLAAAGAIDLAASSLADALHQADIVVLAVPVASYRMIARSIAPLLSPGVIVTDVGSVKNTMLALQHSLPHARLIAAHPIAGSEREGPLAARADLFQGRLCVTTPDSTTDPEAFAVVQALWQSVGADVIAMPAEVHDQIYAHVSHLPHLIAFTAAHYLYRLGIIIDKEDATLQQFLRISRSSPRMWADIATENREALLPTLATYQAVLEHFATELRAGDPPTETVDPLPVAKALLPRILASSLISTVSLYEQQSSSNLRPFGGAGMRDTVAPAAITPEADTEAISHVAPTMADHIDAILADFRVLEQFIGAADNEGLFRHLTALQADAIMLTTPRH